ncbi:MAG: hypothetical protein GY765_07635 [bacterium]|nr:hypothetical protein [bacterium]
MERISHFQTEGAAYGLRDRGYFPGAAKIFRALGVRIVNAGKSKYYSAAIAHLAEYRKLCEAMEKKEEWASFATDIMKRHTRKSGFMPDFKRLVAGNPPKSFKERAEEHWKKQIVY